MTICSKHIYYTASVRTKLLNTSSMRSVDSIAFVRFRVKAAQCELSVCVCRLARCVDTRRYLQRQQGRMLFCTTDRQLNSIAAMHACRGRLCCVSCTPGENS